jgi:hypothetical protein
VAVNYFGLKKPSRLHCGIVPGETVLADGAVIVHGSTEGKTVPGITEKTSVGSFAERLAKTLDGDEDSPYRLAFEVDPNSINRNSGVYYAKHRLIPDHYLKRLAIQDGLVAAVVRTRQNHMSAFGRPRPDRFSTGYVIRPNPETLERLDNDAEARKRLNDRIAKGVKKFATCGSQEGVNEEDRCSFSEWLSVSSRDAVVVGRIAVEILKDARGGFHHFAPVDGGTIYRSVANKAAAESVRSSAFTALQALVGDRAKEMTDSEFKASFGEASRWKDAGHRRPPRAGPHRRRVRRPQLLPRSPTSSLPTTRSRRSTPRSERGDDPHQHHHPQQAVLPERPRDARHAGDQVGGRGRQHHRPHQAGVPSVHQLRQQLVAHAGVRVHRRGRRSSGRPSTCSGGRDMEFQYLSDMNAREILSAFMMSPDELPGYTYLSKGTNSQSLSEGNNEYKLEAARDVGIRPLMQAFEDFINDTLFPLIDPELARECRFSFVGLDADNAEKEAQQLSVQSKLYLTYDDILEHVEKKPVGRKMGGGIPLNPDFAAMLDKYFTAGEILEEFCDRKGAASDPQYAWRNNPLWLQWFMAQQQAQMAAQAPQPPPGGGGGGSDASGAPPGAAGPQGSGGPPGGQSPQPQQPEQKSEDPSAVEALGHNVDAAIAALRKTEASLPPGKRRLIAQADHTIDFFMRGWARDATHALNEITTLASQASGKRKKN